MKDKPFVIKNPVKCMCGHEILTVEEAKEIEAKGAALGWTFEEKLKEMDRIMQLNGDKYHE